MSETVRALNLIGGAWRDSARSLEVFDPADERRLVGTVPRMDSGDVAAAYEAAASACGPWARTSGIERGRILTKAAWLLRDRCDELSQILTAEMGKTLAEARVEIGKSADFFEYFGGLGRGSRGELLAHENPSITTYTQHEPLGVVLAITPWNDPLLTPARKLAPALIAGNAALLKPASATPLIALELARCLDDAGLPAGVLNTVTGSGAEIGPALLDHPALRAVSFTGSNSVGADLRRALAGTDVELLAELGGKNPAVVLADADLDRAAETIAAAAFAQAGQRCTATSRVIVERSVETELLERLVAKAGSLSVGPGSESATDMGPLVSGAQRDQVLGFIERAVTDGAAVLTGGGWPTGDAGRSGCYVAPTVLSGVDPAGEIWNEEVFGPVVSVVAADDLTDALALVNHSQFGLAAAVYTNDAAAIQRFVAGADAGQIAVNLPTSGWDVHMPFGGFKASGSGHKEQGLQGLEFYRRTKTVAIAP